MDDMLPEPGTRILMMEALGYFIGTVEAATPFGIRFGADCVWVRELGPMRDAYRTGKVVECHPAPNARVKDAAQRWWEPWPHQTPKP